MSLSPSGCLCMAKRLAALLERSVLFCSSKIQTQTFFVLCCNLVHSLNTQDKKYDTVACQPVNQDCMGFDRCDFPIKISLEKRAFPPFQINREQARVQNLLCRQSCLPAATIAKTLSNGGYFWASAIMHYKGLGGGTQSTTFSI